MPKKCIIFTKKIVNSVKFVKMVASAAEGLLNGPQNKSSLPSLDFFYGRPYPCFLLNTSIAIFHIRKKRLKVKGYLKCR